MSAAQFKHEPNASIADVAALPLPLPMPPSPSAPTADRIEWSRATILGFIEDYRRHRVLWDPNTKGYHIKQTKYEALNLLSQKYGTEIRSIRSKIKSLRSSFHREHGKVLNGRSRGVHYQPMWFAYEAIRFILDGERDVDSAALDVTAAAAGVGVSVDVKPLLDSEAAEKLALMHSLDLEQLTAVGVQKVEQQQQQHEEFAARVAAAVAVVAAAAAAANVREHQHNMDAGDSDVVNSPDPNSNGCAGGDGDCDADSGSDATATSTAAAAAVAAAAAASAAVTRSSSDLDGETYCNISAEDVKTEIIEHEAELGMLDRQTSTPLSLSYYKPTDLTYNRRKRKAQLDEIDANDGNDGNGGDLCGGVGVGIVGGVVGALTLTPIKSTNHQQQQQQQQQHHHQQQHLNHNQIAFHTLQQHFNHNLSHINHNGNGQPQQQQQQQQQQHQQQQQQHSNNMAQKRDRDRDLSSSPTLAYMNNNNNNNINNNNNNININNNNHSSKSLELSAAAAATTATTTATSSGICSIAATTPIKLSSNKNSNNSNSNNNNNNNNNCSSNSNNMSASHVDEYEVFGEYVAITIRKLKTPKSRIVVKHLINNLLYEAELGKYDQGMPATTEPPQLYKMH
ncbi:GH14852 [Drosophila grimshawi]|uniref:GH14852 n=1 Tax=Drosophila grimshawi TaxID=7222 RepID=B4J2L7_DROGR|nr:GH14852 [Drosophila grimshawi]